MEVMYLFQMTAVGDLISVNLGNGFWGPYSSWSQFQVDYIYIYELSTKTDSYCNSITNYNFTCINGTLYTNSSINITQEIFTIDSTIIISGTFSLSPITTTIVSITNITASVTADNLELNGNLILNFTQIPIPGQIYLIFLSNNITGNFRKVSAISPTQDCILLKQDSSPTKNSFSILISSVGICSSNLGIPLGVGIGGGILLIVLISSVIILLFYSKFKLSLRKTFKKEMGVIS